MNFIISKKISAMVLSSKSRVCKTEKFAIEHSRFLSLDRFITQFAEGILLNKKALEYSKTHNISTAKLTTTDGIHTLYVRFGYSLSDSVAKGDDIIFFAYEDNATIKRKNDISLVEYLDSRDVIEFSFQPSEGSISEYNEILDKDFKKLYVLFNSDQVNFPLLNKAQQEIVTIENNNVLVQGVAGSGKTNICIDKIIYTACKGYSGKLLYTTFSRGLLIDTLQKVNVFKNNIKEFILAFGSNSVIFTDDDKKRAVENKLGLYFNVEVDKIIEELNRIIYYLDNKVDFYLITDLYKTDKDYTFANEAFFVKEFGKLLNTKLSGKYAKVSHLSIEVVYKEIYGMIFGSARNSDYSVLSMQDYVEARKDSFSQSVCETIYSLALDYEKFCNAAGALDNNFISRKLIPNAKVDYSLTIIDEVQDFTEINLSLLKKLSRRMFCVGDALQMINPSFFSFAYLKRLLYEENSVSVSKLENNYRNTQQITEAINKLSELNIGKFGSHNFVLKGKSIEQTTKTTTVYFASTSFAPTLQKNKLDNFTIVVNSVKHKEELRKILKKQEILTVSEIKGLERDTVLLLDILSDNYDKWNALERTTINRKKADENSVYRYYFNLLYVGVSRAKYNLFVVESKTIPTFDSFFKEYFDCLTPENGMKRLEEIVSKVEIDNDELLTRVEEFLKFGQADNARFTANKLEDDALRRRTLTIIDVNERFIQKGRYREAGIALWEAGILDEAKRMFTISGDTALIKLIDECVGKGEGKLDTDIVKFYPELMNNPVAKGIIIDTLKQDSKKLHDDFVNIKKKFRKH